MINTYNQHNLEVVEYFKGREEKLLQISWENGDGWSETLVLFSIRLEKEIHPVLPKE